VGCAALIGIGLLVTGGVYAGASAAMAATEPTSASTTLTVEDGKKLFQANCATCHGLNLEGTADGPSLYGVGELAVEFQMSTGRMPLQMQGPQAPQKPVQFTEDQILAISSWVQSTSPARVPDAKTSTARATSPTAPSSSASTAPCATTSPPPVVHSPRASTLPR
jgi:ubiquinol-cytochrome c reductase cytochrome c subunit